MICLVFYSHSSIDSFPFSSSYLKPYLCHVVYHVIYNTVISRNNNNKNRMVYPRLPRPDLRNHLMIPACMHVLPTPNPTTTTTFSSRIFRTPTISFTGGDQPPSPPQTKRLIPTGEDPYKDSEEDELGGMFCGHSQDCFAGNCVVS